MTLSYMRNRGFVRLTLARAARLAQLSAEAFIEKLGAMGIEVVDYPPEELDEELAQIG